MIAPRPDPVLSSRAAVIAARDALAKLEAEDREAADRLAQIEAAPKVTRDDVLARENAERRRRQLEGEREKGAHELAAALAAEHAAVRAADGVLFINGGLAGPGAIGARSSLILEAAGYGMGGPEPLPAGARARAVSGLGILCAVPDAPRTEVLPFIDVRADHPVTSARLLERPEKLGQEGSETVLLQVGAAAPGPRSAVGAATVRSIRLVSGADGVIRLPVG